MRIFVESLKRLYEQGRTTSDKIESLFVIGKITSEEHDYIIGEEHETVSDNNVGEEK